MFAPDDVAAHSRTFPRSTSCPLLQRSTAPKVFHQARPRDFCPEAARPTNASRARQTAPGSGTLPLFSAFPLPAAVKFSMMSLPTTDVLKLPDANVPFVMLPKLVSPVFVFVSTISQLWLDVQNELALSGPLAPSRPKSSDSDEVPPSARLPPTTSWSKSVPGLLVESRRQFPGQRAASRHRQVVAQRKFAGGRVEEHRIGHGIKAVGRLRGNDAAAPRRDVALHGAASAELDDAGPFAEVGPPRVVAVRIAAVGDGVTAPQDVVGRADAAVRVVITLNNIAAKVQTGCGGVQVAPLATCTNGAGAVNDPPSELPAATIAVPPSIMVPPSYEL